MASHYPALHALNRFCDSGLSAVAECSEKVKARAGSASAGEDGRCVSGTGLRFLGTQGSLIEKIFDNLLGRGYNRK